MVKISPRKDVPFKALFTYHMLKKTGVVPEGECFDKEYFQKAPIYIADSDASKLAYGGDLSASKEANAGIAPHTRRHMAADAVERLDYVDKNPGEAYQAGVGYDTDDLSLISHAPDDKFIVWDSVNEDGTPNHERSQPMDKVRDVNKFENKDLRYEDKAYYDALKRLIEEVGVDRAKLFLEKVGKTKFIHDKAQDKLVPIKPI